MKHTEGKFKGQKDLNLYYQRWQPAPKAILLVVHGFAEHSGRYMNVVNYFVPKGYAVYPVAALEQAVRNATPLLQVKPRRVGGATYQVPVEVQPDRGLFLAINWLIASARARKGKPMKDRLAEELADAFHGQGTTIKKREDTHRMAEANRAFAHYRW